MVKQTDLETKELFIDTLKKLGCPFELTEWGNITFVSPKNCRK